MSLYFFFCAYMFVDINQNINRVFLSRGFGRGKNEKFRAIVTIFWPRARESSAFVHTFFSKNGMRSRYQISWMAQIIEIFESGMSLSRNLHAASQESRTSIFS